MAAFALLLAGAWIQTPPPPSLTVIEPILYLDSGSVTPRANNQRNLDSIVEHALRPGITAVVIRAHTDTVGTSRANLALAEARGRAVAERLVARGVPSGLIRIDARGETQPAPRLTRSPSP